MRAKRRSSIQTFVTTLLDNKFPKHPFNITVSNKPIGYKVRVEWCNGPVFTEVEEVMNKYMRTHKNIREVRHKCTYDDKHILKEAQAIADKSWIKIPLNITNITHLKVYDATLMQLALDALRHKSFEPTATLK